jgi:hypothetical protein
MISTAEAVLLLKGLKEKTSLVRVTLAAPAIKFAFEGFVTDVSNDEVLLMVPPRFKLPCAMNVQFEGARFEYGDTREAPEAQREALAQKFSSALTIALPNKTRVVITELNVSKR